MACTASGTPGRRAMFLKTRHRLRNDIDMSSAHLSQPDAVVAEAQQLKRALGPVNLVLIGIGSIIGAGIFVIAGTAAAQHAGPAVLVSFVIAGLGCLFAGLCYAEFASM